MDQMCAILALIYKEHEAVTQGLNLLYILNHRNAGLKFPWTI